MGIRWVDRDDLNKTVRNVIKDGNVVLDIGCGIRPQIYIEPKLLICCEPHEGYIHVLNDRFQGRTDVVILKMRGLEIAQALPDRSIDSVFLLDVLEHLEKEDGIALLEQCNRIARSQIVVFTPLGYMQQEYKTGERDGWGLDGGKWQSHRSGWTPEDFDTNWQILACKEFHTITPKGKMLDQAFGAFWAINDIQVKPAPRLGKRIAIIGRDLPPSPTDQGILLFQILRGFSVEEYCLISEKNYNRFTCPLTSQFWLPGHIYWVPDSFRMDGIRSLLGEIRTLAKSILNIIIRTIRLVRLIRSEKCKALFTSLDSYISYMDALVCSFASGLLNLPYFVYVSELKVNAKSKILLHIFPLIKMRILKHASVVIVANEFLQTELRWRYHIEPVVLRYPIDESSSRTRRLCRWPNSPGEIRLASSYTQAPISAAVINNLAEAIEQINRPDVQFIYIPNECDDVSKIKASLEKNHSPNLKIDGSLDPIEDADIVLWAIWSYNEKASPNSCKSTELGKYLSCGRPVIAFTSPGSFVGWFLIEHECGIVLVGNQTNDLRDKLLDFIEKPESVLTMVRTAQELAIKEFSTCKVREVFRSVVLGPQDTN